MSEFDYNFAGIHQIDFEKNDKLKDKLTRQYVRYMFNRTQTVFHYEGLPETIPQRNLELYLQFNGLTGIAKVNDDLYALIGGFGGECNAYYEPKHYIVANPWLNFDADLINGENCVVIFNDSTWYGLKPMFIKYASLMAENMISMRMADINLRSMFLIDAPDDRTKKSADAFISDLVKGKMSSVGSNPFFEGLKVSPTTGTYGNAITDLIEYEQYLKASWFNEIGLDANYNMKRESLNSSESQMNDDALIPLIEDMLNMRKEGIEKVNEMFGTNISIELTSVWKKNQQIIVEGEDDETEPNNSTDIQTDEENTVNDQDNSEDIDESADQEESEETDEEPADEEPADEEPAEITEDEIDEIQEELESIADDVEEIKETLDELIEEGEPDETE